MLINMLLMLIFLTYLAFCLVLLTGINMVRINQILCVFKKNISFQRKTCFFIPYFVFDAIFLLLAIIGSFVGLICSYHHLFRACFLFVIIKTFVEINTISLFLKLRHEKTKTPTPIDTSGTIFEDRNMSAV